MSLGEWERGLAPSEHQTGGRIQLLIDQMMVKDQINVVGEGYVHCWIDLPLTLLLLF